MNKPPASRELPDVPGVDFGALAAWMDAMGIGEGPIHAAHPLSGGTQNIIVRFSRSDRSFVLRRPPLSLRPDSSETMRREARLLGAIAGSPVPHPPLIAACGDEQPLGTAFYLMDPVDGFTPTNGLPALHAGDPAIRHRIGISMVEAIAALGMIDYRAVGLEGFGKPDGFLERQIDRWLAQLASYAEYPGWPGISSLPGVDNVSKWLERHRPHRFHPGIMHGDFHLANVMVRTDSGEIAAIVDWELSTIGDPLLDLGWLLATWPEGKVPRPTDVAATPWQGFATRDELIAGYSHKSDRDLSAIDWYSVLACFKLGIILEGTHARACAGNASPTIGARLHAHAIELLERAVRIIA